MLKAGWARCEPPGGRTREEAGGDHPSPADLPAALGLGAEVALEVEWELAGWRRQSSSGEQGWGLGARSRPAPAARPVYRVIHNSGASSPHQQPPLGRTLATWDLQEVDSRSDTELTQVPAGYTDIWAWAARPVTQSLGCKSWISLSDGPKGSEAARVAQHSRCGSGPGSRGSAGDQRLGQGLSRRKTWAEFEGPQESQALPTSGDDPRGCYGHQTKLSGRGKGREHNSLSQNYMNPRSSGTSAVTPSRSQREKSL